MKPVTLFRLLPLLGFTASRCFAFDSYRYLHVTIDTPWGIFLFLLIGIFAPFILMGVLVWRHSEHKPATPPSNDNSKEGHES
ncbi:MAG: hypothetical protein KGJ15_03375 [Betaproteobacteria bacterium]|nr:hypothetical protein [Betaproteobacteria bacterium]